jgi:cytochrome P450
MSAPVAGASAMDVDFSAPEVAADPWPLLRAIREAGPIVWNERGFWMTAHDKVCRDILNRPAEIGQEGAIAAIFGEEAFISIDDRARHDALRGVWMGAFTRQSLEALAPVIRRFIGQMLEPVEAQLRDGATADLMPALCRPLPTYVIGHMMGIAEEDLSAVAEWSDRIGNATASGFPIDYDNDPFWLAGERAKTEFADYLFDQIRRRRAKPSDDLISQLVNSEVGRSLPEDALMVNTRQLLFAGNETTAKWLGHIVVILDRHRDLRRDLAESPALMGQALNEFMRCEPVVHTLPRGVRGEAAHVADVPLARGAEVVLLLGGANRDPARYEDPERLDIRRERKGNLGFGYGMHSCLGVTLSQLEAAEAVAAILARFPDFRLAQPVVYPGFNMRGPEALHVALA